MKIVKKDIEKKNNELRAKEAKLKFDEQKEQYLESLRGSVKFKKYVVDDIFRANLERLTDIRNIKAGTTEEMGKLVFQAQAARIMLEKILGELLND